MAWGSGTSGGPQRTTFRSFRARKDLLGNDREADTDSVPQEAEVYPDETAQRLGNQDIISVSAWKERRKENNGYKGFADTRIYTEQNKQWSNFHTRSNQNARKAGYARKPVPVVSQEFRVVRDNRSIKSTDKIIEPGSPQNSDNCNIQSFVHAPDERNLVGEKLPPPPILKGQLESRQDLATLKARVNDRRLIHELNLEASSSSAMVGGGVESKIEVHSSILASANMSIGLYSSSSDPVHVPSADSRSAGTIGAARRPAGVVGSQQHPWKYSAVQTSIEDGPFSIHLPGKDLSAPVESFGGTVTTPRSNNFNRIPVSEPIISGISISRAHNTGRPNSRSNQQVIVHQKATQSNMEWRPKSSQHSRVCSPGSHHSRNPSDSVEVEAADLSRRFPEVNISDGEHVIIPKHLRVPDADLTHLIFGSFGDRSDSGNIGSVAHHARSTEPGSSDKPSVRISLSVPPGSLEYDSAADKVDRVNNNVATSLANSSHSTTEPEQTFPSNSDFPSPKNIHCFEDISTRLGSNSPLSLHQSTATIIQQQQRPSYPQTHVQQYPNFVPYRQIISPMYVPPMALPSYSSNPAYPHAHSGSSYLFMPGGNSHVAAGGLRYGASQYKPVPAGNYGCPGYTVGTPTANGSIANVDDIARFKYMESGLYVPNVQTARDASMHPSPYDLLDQGAAAQAAYLPNYGGHAPFNGVAHSSPLQYPSGFYHPSLQGSIAAPPPHHVHPQLPLAAAGAVAAPPGAQLGTFQQPQLGHHVGWPANF